MPFALSSTSFGTYNRYLAALVGNSAYSPPPSASFDLLETQVLSSSASSVTFAGLGSYTDYKHLQIRAVLRSTRNDTDSIFYMRFNGDSASNYSMHNLRGTGSAVDSGYLTTSYPSGIIVYTGCTGATNTANSFGANIIDILDPFNSSKYTTTRTLNGQTGSFNRVALEGGSWRNTNSITSISFHDVFGSFAQLSRFSLYGLRAA